MPEGIIIKGYSGFYYVQTEERLWECSLRGKFRQKHLAQSFLPGDRVRITPLKGDKGVIEEVLPRQTELVRPPIANVEQGILVFACKDPDPDLNLLDRLLILTSLAGLEAVICFNKADRLTEEERHALAAPYRQAGYSVVEASAKTGLGVEEIRAILKDRVSVFAGPSGVGKSTMLNALEPNLALKTGAVSEKLGRGRHTTRHVELLALRDGGWVADTPGFSSLYLPPMERDQLASCFPEFLPYLGECRFNSCIHKTEPDCSLRAAVEEGKIDKDRYQQYLNFLDEVIANERRYDK